MTAILHNKPDQFRLGGTGEVKIILAVRLFFHALPGEPAFSGNPTGSTLIALDDNIFNLFVTEYIILRFQSLKVPLILRELQQIRIGKLRIGKKSVRTLMTDIPKKLNATLAKLGLLPLFRTVPKWAV